MSAGAGHGPMGSYPDDWQTADSNVSESVEMTGSVAPVNEEPDDEPEPLVLADSPADARVYKCECGNELDYHADECNGCGETPVWRGIQ